MAIPSAFTLGNLFSGFVGIAFAFKGEFQISFLLILLAAFLDFWDGLLARKLKVDGELGKQLDSLADAVTFGALPALLIYLVMLKGGIYLDVLKPFSNVLPYFSGLILLSSVWRLAKFNTDSEQSTYFKGLATPASAILIGAIANSFYYKGFYYPIFWFNEVSLIFVLLLSWFLNAKMRLLSFKFAEYSLAANKSRYLLILLSLISVFFYSFEAIPIIVILYIGVSFIHFKTNHEI
ncbi:CDP-alcohol phosphatidyltransferase family protein [Hyphobacterium sp. CCMP332]|nr:CDP-alcohol phosphatidyltransferase family protein [Hyphobacterium sp. CCMP332]